MQRTQIQKSRGFTLIELLLAVAMAGLLIAGIAGLMGQVTQIQAATEERNALTRDARFAMQRMVNAVRRTRRLLLPFPDNPGTAWPEHIREQSIPASPPISRSTFASAVLAVTQYEAVDLDGDGVPDADNDGDGLFDEDPYGDWINDTAAGIYQIDDDGDGQFDETIAGQWWDDDEDGGADEDTVNGIDDDGDGKADEDWFMDMNGDGQPGIAGFDDDGDSLVDEGGSWDDDEDGTSDEDSLEPVVFYLEGNQLIERTPVPWDETGVGGVTGRDFLKSTIAGNVTLFRVERVATLSGDLLVDLTLELTAASTESVSLNTRVRVGGAL
jgi:prepilin-type N-terminal cleavage/methylation domain-containing protein